MLPAYEDGDRIVVLYTHNVSDSDIAVVWCDTLNEYLVKRVIGVEGDRIQISHGIVRVNGMKIEEDYLYENKWGKNCEIDIVVPDGHVFVMGDNRNNSTDSRQLGTFSTKDVFGEVLFKSHVLKWVCDGSERIGL